MIYGQLRPRDLDVLFLGLSEANKLLYEKINAPEVAEMWRDLREFDKILLKLGVYYLKPIENKEIDEVEMTKIIVKILVTMFSVMNLEIREKLLPLMNDSDEDEKIDRIRGVLENVDSFLSKVSIHFPDFFEEITQMTIERSQTFIRIWLENMGAIDTSYGYDKSINYQGLEEFLLDLIEANQSTGKEPHLWKTCKDILSQSMVIVRGKYRQMQVKEGDEPDQFASNILTALVTGVNVTLEKEKKGDNYFLSEFDTLKDFDLFHKSLSPGLVWWIKKEMGKEITEDKIIKMESI